MTELIDRLAAGLLEGLKRQCDLAREGDGSDLSNVGLEDAWIDLRQLARDVLASIREPTEAMKSAGIDALAETLNAHDDAYTVCTIFRAMTDAAMREG